MRRMQSLLLALICCLLFLPLAAAENQAPAPQGAVTDWAGVLSRDTWEDAAALSQRLEKAVGGKIYIVTRHFLGGAEALEYGQYLFDAWELGEMDGLLLMVIGEEKYALVLGNKAQTLLPPESQTALLAHHFRTPFLNRDYDAAVAGLTPALGEHLARAAGKKIDVSGLFGESALAAVPPSSGWSDLWNGMFAQVAEEEESDWAAEEAREETRSNWRTVIIWGLVIYFLFFRKKKRRRSRAGHASKGW